GNGTWDLSPRRGATARAPEARGSRDSWETGWRPGTDPRPHRAERRRHPPSRSAAPASAPDPSWAVPPRRCAAASGVLALRIGAAEVLAEPAGLELHVAAALVAFDHRTIIALDLELPLLYLEAA